MKYMLVKLIGFFFITEYILTS